MKNNKQKKSKEGKSTKQDVSSVQSPIFLAKEMGKELGRSEILQRSLQQRTNLGEGGEFAFINSND